MTYRLLLPPPFFFTDLRDKFKTLHPPFLRFSHEPKKKKKKKAPLALLCENRDATKECGGGEVSGTCQRQSEAHTPTPHSHYSSFRPQEARALASLGVQATVFSPSKESETKHNRRETAYLWNATVCVCITNKTKGATHLETPSEGKEKKKAIFLGMVQSSGYANLPTRRRKRRKPTGK